MTTQVSMYQAVMGDAFDRLAAPVRQFHRFAGHHTFHGQVRIAAPESLPARLLALALGTPQRAGEGPVRFELIAGSLAETWTRFFPGKTMRSVLIKDGCRLSERLGAARLGFSLVEVDGALEMRLASVHLLGIACPKWLMPTVVARETGDGHRFCFEVRASVPVMGLVAGYRGHLEMPVEVSSDHYF